jgi:hypothetical protein
VLLLTDRRITIAVILGIALVFGIAGWRFFTGEAEKASVARLVAPVAKPTPVAATEPPPPLDQAGLTQQFLVDDLQFLESRVSKQEAEIKRLKAELEAMSQKYEALASFASTAKEAKPAPAAQPPKTSKKPPVRRSRKR